MSSAALLSEWPTSEPFHWRMCQNTIDIEEVQVYLAHMVVELVPRNSHIITCMRDIQKTIIVILIACETLRREVTVVNPHFSRPGKRDEVLALRWIMKLQVADDNVAGVLDAEATISQSYITVNTETRLIARIEQNSPELE